MSRKSPYEIVLSEQEREELMKRARKRTAPYRDVIRAKAILLAAEGLPNDEIAKRLDTTRQKMSRWRKRFYEERLEGLRERPGRGRRPSFSPSERGGGQGHGL